MIVKVGPVTLRVSYHLVKAVKNFINHLVEKELLKEFDNL